MGYFDIFLRNRKSQNSLEQLSSYGIAILIVIISVAVLAYYGIFKADEFLPDKCEFSTEGLECVDYVINPSPAGNITLYVKNNMGRPIYNFTAVFADIDDIYNQGVDKGERVRFDISYVYYTKTSGVYVSHAGTGKLVARIGQSITGNAIQGFGAEAGLLATTSTAGGTTTDAGTTTVGGTTTTDSTSVAPTTTVTSTTTVTTTTGSTTSTATTTFIAKTGYNTYTFRTVNTAKVGEVFILKI